MDTIFEKYDYIVNHPLSSVAAILLLFGLYAIFNDYKYFKKK